MSYHDRFTDNYREHERELRRDEFRPGDPIPLRFQPKPLSTAHDVAILVRNLKNVDDAAALIDRYADAKAAEQRLDAVAAGANA
ncbi:MAG TPA: hypothetical protein VF499_04260 [Afipia sp.]